MRLLKWLIGLVIVVGILLTAVPLVAKWYLVRWLQANGYEAEIKKLGMDFIFGELGVQGVTLQSARGERFEVFDASADFDWWALKDRKLVVDRLKVDSARLDVRRTPQGVVVAGFLLDPLLTRLSSGWPLEIRLGQMINTDVCRASEQCLRMESITVSRAKWLPVGQSWGFSHSAPLTIEKAFLRDQANNTTLFYGAELSVGRGSYSSGAADMETVSLRNFQFVENNVGTSGVDAPYQTQLGEMSITALAWRSAEPRLILGSVDITSLRQSLHRMPDGTFEVPPRAASAFEGLNWRDVHLSVEKVEVRDGALAWFDQSVTPPAMANLSSLHLQLSGVDSSAPGTATSMQLSGKVGQNGRVNLAGDIYPYRQSTTFTLTGFVQEVELAKLAGYSRKYLNQSIDQGMVDLSISAVARNNTLEASTRWQLANLRIEPTRGNSGDMPLELSYDLLKDHNNSVSLEMPIRGEFGSDRLKPEYIFARQMRRVMSDMARRRVNPVGAVAIPNRNVPSGKMAFRPLEYTTNNRYPAEADNERLKEVAAMLREKPHLSMMFCPVSTGGEWAELFNGGERPTATTELPPEHKEQLLELANVRGRILRSRLIEAGVAADQIVICSPSVDMTQFGLSFVSISL